MKRTHSNIGIFAMSDGKLLSVKMVVEMEVCCGLIFINIFYYLFFNILYTFLFVCFWVW